MKLIRQIRGLKGSLTRRIVQGAAIAILTGTGLIAGSTPGNAQTRDIIIDDGVISNLEMAPGRTVTIKTNATFADILIGNPGVVDVFPLTDDSLYVQSKATGATNITLYSVDKKLLEVIDVRVRISFSDLEKEIRRAVPSAQVSVQNVNNRIRISGQVKDNLDKVRVLQIAEQYSEDDVIDGIRVLSAQQVELDVRILEVERTSGRNLGVDLTGTRGDGSTAFQTRGRREQPLLLRT